MIAKLAAKPGTRFSAVNNSAKSCGSVSTAITSMVSANANAASTNVSRRVGCAPRSRSVVSKLLPPGSLERADPRQFAADRKLVDGLRAFVGDHAFQVQRVTDRDVFGADAGAAQDVAGVARDFDR